MQVCSTVLFFGELPYGYDLIRTEQGFRLVPASNGIRRLPSFDIKPVEAGWEIGGPADGDLEAQIQKLLQRMGTLVEPLQAAP
ncbi:MAG: hypothetical protein JWP88_333 [Flaviaesturariibacter sp.]|nr:hypothetical protein [Flaviaesturariibacter sp.]